MKAYRIGRKHDGPWINMTPPIRGGIYHKLEALVEHSSDSDSECDEEDTCDDGSSATSIQSSLTSLTSESSAAISIEEKVLHQTLTQRRVKGSEDHVVAETNAEARTLLSPSRYTDLLMQEEIDKCISEYPSLNPMVQQDIIQKYRELHQKVRGAGLYDCPYVEYGKEMSRYLALFGLFAVAVRSEWYLTGAVFLGLFWVRYRG